MSKMFEPRASLHARNTMRPLWNDMLTFDGLNPLIGTPDLLAEAQRYE